MSDLDDFFAKRLDEEANFPNRGKSWAQMSKRLDAFDSGAIQGKRPGMRGWQLATLAAVAVAGFLMWKILAIQHENKMLHQNVASLQTEQAKLADRLVIAEKNAAGASMEATPGQLPASTAHAEKRSLILVKKDAKLDKLGMVPTEKKTEISERMVDVSDEKLPDGASKNATEQQSDAPNMEVEQPGALTSGLAKSEPKSMDSTVAESIDIALIHPALDSLKNIPLKKDTLLAEVEEKKDSIASNPSLAQEIKPQRSSKSRFRIGAQATFGFVQPQQKGVSALRGQGLSMEARVFRSLWVAASVDWLHHEVSTEEFVPRFHPHHDSLPEPPNGGGGGGGGMHSSKLVLVESAPREQHFGLGLRYQLPVKFWLRPSVRIAHEWVRVSSTLVTYKFEEEDPGGPGGPGWHDHEPEYTAEKFDAQWLTNQWRFGIGLEKDIPNWTFGLWADYSKDFSAATPSFDALYVRAGAQFRF